YSEEKSKNKSKKRANINKVTIDSSSESGSDINSSDNDSLDLFRKNPQLNPMISIQKIILNMLDGIAPIDWIEKLKFKIDNPSSIPPSTSKPDFINYREPVSESDGEEETLDDPMEMDLVQKKEPATDVVTTKCKIKKLVIPAATVDPGANFPI
ncbi:6152_t:CDS:2, partial [Paraglomus brasilianum]